MKSTKLSEVWKKHFDKIVDIQDIQKTVLTLLEERLTEDEKKAFLAVADKSSPFTRLPQSAQPYKGRNNKGRKSTFIDTGSVMMAFNRTAPVLGPLQEKVEDVMAEAFEQARDYKPDVDAGKLKPYILPRHF